MLHLENSDTLQKNSPTPPCAVYLPASNDAGPSIMVTTDHGNSAKRITLPKLVPPAPKRSRPPTFDPVMYLSHDTVVNNSVHLPIYREGRISLRSSCFHQAADHLVYRTDVGNTNIVRVGMIIWTGTWYGTIRSVHSLSRTNVRFVCKRRGHPFFIIKVPLANAVIPWHWRARIYLTAQGTQLVQWCCGGQMLQC